MPNESVSSISTRNNEPVGIHSIIDNIPPSLRKVAVAVGTAMLIASSVSPDYQSQEHISPAPLIISPYSPKPVTTLVPTQESTNPSAMDIKDAGKKLTNVEGIASIRLLELPRIINDTELSDTEISKVVNDLIMFIEENGTGTNTMYGQYNIDPNLLLNWSKLEELAKAGDPDANLTIFTAFFLGNLLRSEGNVAVEAPIKNATTHLPNHPELDYVYYELIMDMITNYQFANTPSELKKLSEFENPYSFYEYIAGLFPNWSPSEARRGDHYEGEFDRTGRFHFSGLRLMGNARDIAHVLEQYTNPVNYINETEIAWTADQLKFFVSIAAHAMKLQKANLEGYRDTPFICRGFNPILFVNPNVDEQNMLWLVEANGALNYAIAFNGIFGTSYIFGYSDPASLSSLGDRLIPIEQAIEMAREGYLLASQN